VKQQHGLSLYIDGPKKTYENAAETVTMMQEFE